MTDWLEHVAIDPSTEYRDFTICHSDGYSFGYVYMISSDFNLYQLKFNIDLSSNTIYSLQYQKFILNFKGYLNIPQNKVDIDMKIIRL